MINFQNRKITLHCRNIIKTYGKGNSKIFALQGVNLDVYEGEILMLVGPSGCGKTTFISVVSSLIRLDSGVCTILGEDLNRMGDSEKVSFRGKSIGFVFQSFNLLPALNAKENVAIPLIIQGITYDKAIKQAKEMLNAVGLESYSNKKPNELSGGEQQRVAIARALIHNPQLIICDEPTSNLDYKSGQLIMNLLRKIIQEREKTLIVVTHDNRIYKYGDRMAYMEDGKIVKVESIE